MEKIDFSKISLIFILFTLLIMYIPINSIYRDVNYAMYS